MIDDVAIGGSGLAGGAVGTSAFENATDIDNGAATDQLALGAWRATGKPPAVFFHTHPLTGGNGYAPLTYQDICGPPGSPQRFCNMAGVVISAGDHDHGEAAGGLVPSTPERERMDGILSPTVLLASSGAGDYNACGVDLPGATPTDGYYVAYDIYTGVFDLFFTGNAWTYGFQSYPARQLDGTVCWGEVRFFTIQIYNPDVQCLQDFEPGLIRTTNPGVRPDSLRIYLGKNQECFRFGITGSACSSTAGAYFDNVSLLISDAPFPDFAGGMFANIWAWYNDTFPANDNTSLVPGAAVAPGTAGFDTAAAYIKMGQNIAQSPGTANRFDIPGDSALAVGDLLFSQGDRVDMVFRIKPGVGNYHTIGDPTSGLRPVPTDPVNIVSTGDNSFWGQYMASPGTMSKGIHGPGSFWNRNVWNSARMDTADINIFPVQSNLGVFDVNQNFNATLTWMATYHESDPKYITLGIPHNRCFLVNPASSAPVNSTNITCNSVPAWANASAGYDGLPTTREGTKIIPDGQLTPGAHVQYFFRGQADGPRDDVGFYMVPETTYVSPQFTESLTDFNGSTDGHRWQQFGVLPDRWKDPAFSDSPRGTGMACMLYVDLDDRLGDERVWVSVADSLGATPLSRRGAHNGWAANCDACITDANGDPIDVSTNPTVARYDHGGQPGGLWDMYGVKASELVTTSSGQLGCRMGIRADGLAAGKDARLGPTPAMLRTYYKMLLILTGDLNSGILGPFINRGQNDIALLEDFMSVAAPGNPNTTRRAVYIAGDGFVQSEYKTGSTGTFSDHLHLLTDYLGVTIKTDGAGNPQYSYQPWSGDFAQYSDIFTGAAPGPGGPLPTAAFKVGNACLWGNDVLSVVSNPLNAQASAYYTNSGANGQYVASVYTPVQTGKFYESYVDAWDIQHLYAATNTGAITSRGRLGYFGNVLNQISAQTGLCGFYFILPLDVPGKGQAIADYMALFNNPMSSGHATVHFGIAHPDRVTARVYDVGGRLVRVLADRSFPPGEYDLAWDGSDDRGRAMPRGVYFTEIHYARTGFRETKKLTVLR